MLPITYSLFVAPVFNHHIITSYCSIIDDCHTKQLKCNEIKRDLLSVMHNIVDVADPSNSHYLVYFDHVKEDIQ